MPTNYMRDKAVRLEMAATAAAVEEEEVEGAMELLSLSG